MLTGHPGSCDCSSHCSRGTRGNVLLEGPNLTARSSRTDASGRGGHPGVSESVCILTVRTALPHAQKQVEQRDDDVPPERVVLTVYVFEKRRVNCRTEFFTMQTISPIRKLSVLTEMP